VHAEDGRNIGFGKSIVCACLAEFSGQLGRKNSAAEEKSSTLKAIVKLG
jgi:hypothetical protein